MEKELIIKHWIESSDQDFDTASSLLNSNSFSWSLFIGHISLEKLLKALYLKRNDKNPPFIHNLYRLAELSNIEISNEYADWLDEITSFNINARYDDYKKEFYNLCTKEYANKWINRIEIIRKWIKQML